MTKPKHTTRNFCGHIIYIFNDKNLIGSNCKLHTLFMSNSRSNYITAMVFGAIFEIPNKWSEYRDSGSFLKSAQKLLPRWRFLGWKIHNKKTAYTNDFYGKLMKLSISKIVRQVCDSSPLFLKIIGARITLLSWKRHICVEKAQTIFLAQAQKLLKVPRFTCFWQMFGKVVCNALIPLPLPPSSTTKITSGREDLVA